MPGGRIRGKFIIGTVAPFLASPNALSRVPDLLLVRGSTSCTNRVPAYVIISVLMCACALTCELFTFTQSLLYTHMNKYIYIGVEIKEGAS